MKMYVKSHGDDDDTNWALEAINVVLLADCRCGFTYLAMYKTTIDNTVK